MIMRLGVRFFILFARSSPMALLAQQENPPHPNNGLTLPPRFSKLKDSEHLQVSNLWLTAFM
jgi:hypothetical protein